MPRTPPSDTLWPWISSPPHPEPQSLDGARLLHPSLKPGILLAAWRYFFHVMQY